MTDNPSFEQHQMRVTAKAVDLAATRIRAQGRELPRIILSTHVEAKLAGWALILRDAGFGVCVSPSNPASTMPDAADQLRAQGVAVLDHDPAKPPSADYVRAVTDFAPDLVLDDGALLIRDFMTSGTQLPQLRGAVEFTTSGHDLLEMSSEVTAPVLDVGVSYCKYELGNIYGTGVSALAALCSTVNVHLGAKRVLVVGYGAVGRSVAMAARSLGASVSVADNKVRNLARAHFDGHEVGALPELIGSSDIVFTCSGAVGVMTAELMTALPDQAIVANVGCFASEIDVEGLRRRAVETQRHERQIETFELEDGRHVHVLADAELVNLALGRGWPIELIDLTFALSTLCFAELCTTDLPAGLHRVSTRLDEEALQLFFDTRTAHP